jgi:hypothetical protein
MSLPMNRSDTCPAETCSLRIYIVDGESPKGLSGDMNSIVLVPHRVELSVLAEYITA